MKPLFPVRRSSSAPRASRRSLLSLLLAAAVVLASLSPVLAVAPNTAGFASTEPPVTKVLAPAGVLDAAAPGVRLWHDYGAFGLLRQASPARQLALGGESNAAVPAVIP